MNHPTEILYPRAEGVIKICNSKKEKQIEAEILQIQNSDLYKRYLALSEELNKVKTNKPKFVCGKCYKQTNISKLTLYKFVSYSDTMDNDRYVDDNVICPHCKCFNYFHEPHGPFKEVIEINEKKY